MKTFIKLIASGRPDQREYINVNVDRIISFYEGKEGDKAITHVMVDFVNEHRSFRYDGDVQAFLLHCHDIINLYAKY